MLKALLLPLMFVLPTDFAVIFCIAVSMAVLNFSTRIKKESLLIIFALLCFSVISILYYAAYETDEVKNFALRGVGAAITWITFVLVYSSCLTERSILAAKSSALRYTALLAVIHAIALIIFVLNPGLFEFLKVASLTGFNKSASLIRNPGLTSGFDSAGFLCAIGILSITLTRLWGCKDFWLRNISLSLLLVASIFTSRSGLLAAATLYILSYAALRKYRSKDSFSLPSTLGVCLALLFIVLSAALIFFGDNMPMNIADDIDPVITSISRYYSLQGGFFNDPGNFSIVHNLIASDNDFVPDPLYTRVAAFLGLPGLISVSVILYLLLRSARNLQRHVFIMLCFFYLLINFKNTYLFMPSYIGFLYILSRWRVT
jgi:hypothetical protein